LTRFPYNLAPKGKHQSIGLRILIVADCGAC
jgi:hypothetical protein